MKKFRLPDFRLLSKELNLNPINSFIVGMLFANHQQLDRSLLLVCSEFFVLLEQLLQMHVIGQNQKVSIIEMSLNLGLNRIQEFKETLQCLTQNENLQDFDQALKHSFNKIKHNKVIIKQEIVQKPSFSPQNNKLQKRSMSSDTIVLDDSVIQEQRKMMVQLENQKQQQQMDIEFVKKIQMEEEQNLKRAHANDDGECGICYVGLQEDYELLQCGHVFHRNCLQMGFKQGIDNKKFPIICPQENCGKQVQEFLLKQILTEEYFQKFKKFQFSEYVDRHQDEYSWCPTPGCVYCFFYQAGQNQFECQVCKKVYCLKCRVDWHKNMTCEQYQATRDPQKGQKKFQQFVKGMKFKQCPSCKFWVNKDVGCDSLTCRCGTFFCYKCGDKQQYSHGPCSCNNGAGQFGNMFARPPQPAQPLFRAAKPARRRKKKN